ncbi:Gustatory receptor 127, partial [Hyalella azteca]
MRNKINFVHRRLLHAMKKTSLQRWFEALKFMGLYWDLKYVAPNNRDEIVGRAIENSSDMSNTTTDAQLKCIDQEKKTIATKFNNIRKITWYCVMNALYLTCSTYLISTRNYSDGTMSEIILSAWFVVAPVAVVFCVLKCKFSQHTFSEIFAVLSRINFIEKPVSHCSCKFKLDSFLLFFLFATRSTDLCLLIMDIQSLENEGIQALLLQLMEGLASFVCWALPFTLILSFNFFVGVLKKNFEGNSAQLAGHGTSVGNHDSGTQIYRINPVGGAARQLKSATNILKEIEHQLLLIDQAIELLTRLYSSILILLSISHLFNLFFSIYYLAITKESGGHDVTHFVVYIIEALSFLFLMHNPGDELTDAEEKLMVNLRMFIHRLPDDQRMQPNSGLVLALQRPRKLSLCSFGSLGRSSFLN